MKNFGIASLSAVLMLAATGAGCRALPVSYAMMVVGDAVSDIDVKNRQEDLVGKTATAADGMFGQRLATLVDPRRDRRLIVYPVKGASRRAYAAMPRCAPRRAGSIPPSARGRPRSSGTASRC